MTYIHYLDAETAGEFLLSRRIYPANDSLSTDVEIPFIELCFELQMLTGSEAIPVMGHHTEPIVADVLDTPVKIMAFKGIERAFPFQGER